MTVRHQYTDKGLYTPENATSLLIGTFPSVLIRQQTNKLKPGDVNFFYGSSDNFLWPDLSDIYSTPLDYEWTDIAIEQRKKLLDSMKTAITDIILSCETDGKTTDESLENYVINESLIALLDNNPTITKIFFTSGSGNTSAEKLTMKFLRKKKIITKRKVVQKGKPAIRTFDYKSSNGTIRKIEAITLYSPSPTAKRRGVTDEKRRLQYETYLPKISA